MARTWLLPPFPLVLMLLAACGEPIEPKGPAGKPAARSLPVVASPRQEIVGEAYRVTLALTRWPVAGDEETVASSEISSYVDVVEEVEDGVASVLRRYRDDGSSQRVERGGAVFGFEDFEALLPRRKGDVPSEWTVHGVLGALRHTRTLPRFPEAGVDVQCRIERVVVQGGHARAVVAVELEAPSTFQSGPLRLRGSFAYDMKLKLLVRVDL